MFITIYSKKIWYEIYGAEYHDTLLYLHGGPGASCLDFVNQAKALSENMKVVILDQLGVLRSEAIAENESYSMEYQIEMLEEMRKSLGIEKWSILGHSYGGGTMSVERMMRQAASACIQCRACTDLCPRQLIGHNVEPHRVMRNIWRQESITDAAKFERTFGSAANCSSCGTCEMFSCPMGLSPRKMNDYAKALLRERGIQPEKNQEPVKSTALGHRRIPTERLIARLDLTQYVSHGLPKLYEVTPKEVFVPLSQHIGKPAVPVAAVGDEVKRGDLIAEAAEGLSANIHTGFEGVVKEITPQGIR